MINRNSLLEIGDSLVFLQIVLKNGAVVDYNIEAEYLSYVWVCPYVWRGLKREKGIW